MKPSNRNNRSDFGGLDWYGHQRRAGDRFVWLVLGNLTAAYDGEKLFIRIGYAGRKADA